MRSSVPFSALLLLVAQPVMSQPAPPPASTPLTTGAQALVASGFAELKGKRVGLVTNQTGLVGGQHLADVMHKSGVVKLTAILAPEHGFRGGVEAGAKVRDGVDTKTGIPVLSLYGATRKPTPHMLRNVDILVFDIQDVGVRFYTYISTMGLAMQAAAAKGIPFVVLDRPNPLGGTYVSGFVLEPALTSFVGQYPIPIVHGMTVAELAHMIKGERMLAGLERLDLRVMVMKGWRRDMRWPGTGRPWVATSPNVPSFESALLYPGIGIVGELEVSEGRGTPTPFQLFGAPWLDAPRVAGRLTALRLPGVRFEAVTYTPRAIADVASKPRFDGKTIPGVRVHVTAPDRVEPLEIGAHALAMLIAEAKAKGAGQLVGNPSMFNAIAGTRRLRQMLDQGRDGAAIIAAWQDEVRAFNARRQTYLLY